MRPDADDSRQAVFGPASILARPARAALCLCLLQMAVAAALTPSNLRCEYRRNPLAIDAARPRLSWTLKATERGQMQSAFQVIVASSSAALAREEGDLWDSGRVASSQTAQIEYAGKPLASHQRVFWKVRVWDRSGEVSGWSEPAEWSMGVLLPEDWKAQWIALRRTPLSSGPLPLFRKEFVVNKPVRRGIVYSSGVGFHELHLNGVKVGDAVLSPLWTNYRKTVFYVAHDITASVKLGRNVLAAELGNGFYNVVGGRYIKFAGSFGTPALLVMARFEHEDGTVTIVGSDGSWKTAPGPTVFSCIHGGEDYDARLEPDGWMQPGFDDSQWASAAFDGAPGGRLLAQAAPPVKVMQRFRMARVTQPAPGIRVYDLGQNFAGWPRIRVRGRSGASVKMTPGELLTANGRVDQTSAVGPHYQGPGIWFSYTLKGNGVEEWHPRFTYTGFRYVEVQVEGDAEVLSLEGEFVHSSAERAGSFISSNSLFNRINELVDYAVRSNLQSVLTDCPHREKLGWLEVAHLMGPSILFNFDAPAFFEKVSRDTRESQLDNGLVPDIAPEYTVFRDGFRDSPEWGSAAVVIPWMLYRWFGDARVLAESYPAMARYESYLARMARDGILTHGLGDWLDIGPGEPGPSQLTPRGITATAFHYHNLKILEQAAALLGRDDDRIRYAAQAELVRSRFHSRFFNASKGYYATGSQAAQAIPLVLEMVPSEHRPRVLAQLIADIRSRGNQQTAGDIGYRFVIRALTDAGRSDVLYDMNTRTGAPGYGFQISQGVTSLAEAWDASRLQSQNHCMLGHIQEWFMSGLAGIGQAEGSIGFEKIVIRPQVVGDLTAVAAHYDSIRGRIESRWSAEGPVFRLHVAIPPGTTALVYIPASSARQVTEGQTPADTAPGVRFVREDEGAAVYEIVSGEYAFSSSGFRRAPQEEQGK